MDGMDAGRFDQRIRTFATAPSRRALLTALVSQLLAVAFPLFGDRDVGVAARARAKRRHRSHRNRVQAEKRKKKKRKRVPAAPLLPPSPPPPPTPPTATGSPPSSPTCAQSCAGCCDGETCRPGTSLAACGANGAPCGACSGAQGTCFDGACRCGDVCASGCRYVAVQDAVADPNGPATLTVCAGTFIGNITIDRDVTLVGAGGGADPAANTILQGTGNGAVVTADGNITVTLQELRVTGGLNGGGIRNNAALTLINCTITGNSALIGGGIYNLPGRPAHLTGCLVSANTATYGGGVLNSGPFTIESSTISENAAVSGGGLFNAFPATLNDCTVERNSAGDQGGGIFLGDDLTLNGSRVSENTAGTDGGGIWGDSFTTVTLTASSVRKNFADRGAGVYAKGAVTVDESSVEENTADRFGGGIFNDGGAVTLRNASTITANQTLGRPPPSGSGGGVLNTGVVDPTDGTITGNTPDDCVDVGTGAGCPP
jgi:hypothetical protein